MTPQQRAAVRGGCNLAELPAVVREELEREKAVARDQHRVVQGHAQRIFAIRRDRARAERELKQLGELRTPVKAALNKLISRSGR